MSASVELSSRLFKFAQQGQGSVFVRGTDTGALARLASPSKTAAFESEALGCKARWPLMWHRTHSNSKRDGIENKTALGVIRITRQSNVRSMPKTKLLNKRQTALITLPQFQPYFWHIGKQTCRNSQLRVLPFKTPLPLDQGTTRNGA